MADNRVVLETEIRVDARQVRAAVGEVERQAGRGAQALQRLQQAAQPTSAWARLNAQVGSVQKQLRAIRSQPVIALAGQTLHAVGQAAQFVVAQVERAGLALVGLTTGMAMVARQATRAWLEIENYQESLSSLGLSAAEVNDVLERMRRQALTPGSSWAGALALTESLLAIGQSAQFAERAVAAIGNALDASGRGGESMREIGTALRRLALTGQLNTRTLMAVLQEIPATMRILQSAYGTADVQAILDRADPAQVINTLIAAFERLRSEGGAVGDQLEMFGERVSQTWQLLGRAMAAHVAPIFERVNELLDRIVASGALERIGQAIGQALQRLTGLASGGDGLQRVLATALAVAEVAPSAIAAVWELIRDLFSATIRLMQRLVDYARRLMDALGQIPGVGVAFRGVSQLLAAAGRGIDQNVFGGAFERAASAFREIGTRYRDVLAQYQDALAQGGSQPAAALMDPEARYVAQEAVAAIASPLEQIQQRQVAHLQEIASNTRALRDIRDVILGGGTYARQAFNRVTIEGLARSRALAPQRV